MSRRHLLSLLAILSLVLPLAAARAQDLPSAATQEIMIRTAVLTLNDANVVNNYTVLRARTSSQFQSQITAEQLQASFKGFRDQRVELWSVATDPLTVETAEFTVDGRLHLAGRFTTGITSPNIGFDLEFVSEDTHFVIVGINVKTVAKTP